MTIRKTHPIGDTPEPPGGTPYRVGFVFTDSGSLPQPLESTDYQVLGSHSYPRAYSGQDFDATAGQWIKSGCNNNFAGGRLDNLASSKIQGGESMQSNQCVSWKIDLAPQTYRVWLAYGNQNNSSHTAFDIYDGIMGGNQTLLYSQPVVIATVNRWRTILNDGEFTVAQIEANWDASFRLFEVTDRGAGNTGLDFSLRGGTTDWGDISHIRVFDNLP